uniref:Putative secreted protein n=1 Tax=Anopheles darlingi TaxID=43151 RepID=A0A2M4D7Z9_ANODA
MLLLVLLLLLLCCPTRNHHRVIQNGRFGFIGNVRLRRISPRSGIRLYRCPRFNRHIDSFVHVDRTDIVIRTIVDALRFLQVAHLADTVHPSSHIVLGFGGEIVGTGRCLHVEHVGVLFLLPIEPQPGIDLLALIEIDRTL